MIVVSRTGGRTAESRPRSLLNLVLVSVLATHFAISAFYTVPRQWDLLRSLAEAAARGELGAYYRDDYGAVLQRVSAEVPEGAALLLVNSGSPWQPSIDSYFRASYHLYPRKVWWAAPIPRTSPLDRHIEISLEGDSLARAVREHGARYILIEDIPLEEIHLASGAPTIWLGSDPPRHLVDVQ